MTGYSLVRVQTDEHTHISVITRLRLIPEITDNTDTDTGSDVTATTTSCFTLLCVSTEQACIVCVCVCVLQKILKVLKC